MKHEHSTQSANLIFYGTLRDPEILELVAGPKIASKYWQSQTISGYSLVFVDGEQYPGLKPQAGASFIADLYVGLSPCEVRTITDYEGDEYQLTSWTLHECCFQIFLPGKSTRLTDSIWDLQYFQKHLKSSYLRDFNLDTGTTD